MKTFSIIVLLITINAVPLLHADVATLTPVADTYINESSPDGNNGEWVRLRIGPQGEDLDNIAFIRFPISEGNIPDVPEGSRITDAFITMYVWANNDRYQPEMSAFRVIRPENWTENGLRWSDNWAYDNNALEVGDFGTDGEDRLFWRSRTATDRVLYLVRDWYEGNVQNDGFAIAADLNQGNTFNAVDFHSKDTQDGDELRPTLTIFYDRPPPVQLILHWNFQLGNAIDQSGNGLDGTVSGARFVNGGLLFDGEDDYVTRADNNLFTWNDGFMAIATVSPNDREQTEEIMRHHLQTGEDEGWTLQMGGSNTLSPMIKIDGQNYYGSGNVRLENNIWTTVALAWDGSRGVGEIWIDGNGHPIDSFNTQETGINSRSDFCVGRLSANHPANPYAGLIRDVKLYNFYDREMLDVRQNNPISLPATVQIMNCYPNPFNATTIITYGIPFRSQVSLALFDLSGRRISTLVDKYLSPGVHMEVLRSDNLASGIYLIRIETSRQMLMRKVILIR